jgi:hypothetical protein
MILRAPCIIDFIGANGLLGSVGGEGALDTPGPLYGSDYADLQVPYVNIQG